MDDRERELRMELAQAAMEPWDTTIHGRGLSPRLIECRYRLAEYLLEQECPGFRAQYEELYRSYEVLSKRVFGLRRRIEAAGLHELIKGIEERCERG